MGVQDINALAQASADGEKRVYLGGHSALYYFVEGQEIYPLRTSGLTPGGRWDLLAWGKYLLATNDLDPIQLWPNVGLAASIADGPLTASIIKALNIYILAFNAGGEDGRVEWCVGGNPLLWTPTLENDAGGFNIRNVTSKIRAVEQLGDNLLAFTQSQIFVIQYVGGDTIITYRDLSPSLGAIGKKCTVAIGGSVFGLERRGFWQTDGVSERWLAEPMDWDYFKDRIDFDRGDEITVFYNRDRGTVEWNWPIVGSSAFEGAAYDLKTGQWGQRAYGLTAAVGDGVFGQPVAANGAELRLMNTGVNAGEAALASYVQTKPLAVGDTNLYKFLSEIRVRKSGTALLTIGLQESPDDAIVWLDPVTLTERHFPDREAAFFTLKFSSVGLGDDWSVSAWEFYGTFGGSRL